MINLSLNLLINLLGFAASLAVLATFLARTMLPLRAIAVASNILFIAYGYFAHIPPVLCLHVVLLPVNIARLAALREQPLNKVHSLGWPNTTAPERRCRGPKRTCKECPRASMRPRLSPPTYG